MKKPKPPRPAYALRCRSYPDAAFVTLWLVRRDGPAEACLMWGEVLPLVVDEIAAATGLPVERETLPFRVAPLGVRGCATAAEQRTLFPEG